MEAPIFPNSATIHVPEWIVLRKGSWRIAGVKVRYALWNHPQLGMVVADTGYSPRATAGVDRSPALKIYGALLRPRLDPEGGLNEQLAQRGVTRADVKHVIVTHFHADHIASLKDFPSARFIVSGEGWDRLKAMSTWQRLRHGIFDELLPDDMADRLVRLEVEGLKDLPLSEGKGWDVFGDDTCYAVPLPGHADGHFGLLWPQLGRPLFYAVDTQWLWRAIAEKRGPKLSAALVFTDRLAGTASEARVRTLAAAGCDIVMCHDPDDGPFRLETDAS